MEKLTTELAEMGPLEKLQLRLDGFINFATGLASAAWDKAANAWHVAETELSQTYLSNLFHYNWLARRACAVVPEEMLRPGYELMAEDATKVTAIRMALDDLHALERLEEAFTFERVHGGAAIFLGAEDGIEDQSLPLSEASLRRLTGLTVLERERVQALRWYEDPAHPKFGQVSHWQITPANGKDVSRLSIVHESRLLIFEGGLVTQEERIRRAGWGASVLQVMHDVIRDHDQSWSGLAHMLSSASQGVWKFKNLISSLRSGGDAAKQFYDTRLRLTQATMGVNRGIYLDADGEDYIRVPMPFTGVPESIETMLLRVSGAAEMPVMVLFGQSPSGLSATGERDMQWFYDRIDVARGKKLKPKLERLIELLMASKEGPTKGAVLPEWDLKFPPMKAMTALEEVDIRFKQGQTDAIEMQWGVVSPDVIRKSRHRPEGWNWRTQVEQEDEKELDRQQLPEPAPGEPGGDKPEGEDVPQNPNAVDPQSALNGGQVTAMMAIVTAVAEKAIPRTTGVAMMVASFPMDETVAEAIMGDVGKSFFVEKPEPPPGLFPGEKPPMVPPAKPEDKPEPEPKDE